jgi:hypothetical protein
MTLNSITEKLKIVWSLVLRVLSCCAILFHCILESGAIYYRLPISAFIRKDFDRGKVPDQDLKDLELWNSFGYFPSIICFDFLKGQYLSDILTMVKLMMQNIYLLLTGLTQMLTSLILNIPKWFQNISVLMFSSLLTVISLLSLTIAFFGMVPEFHCNSFKDTGL